MRKKTATTYKNKDYFRQFQWTIMVVFVTVIGAVFSYQMPKQNHPILYTKNSFFEAGILPPEAVTQFPEINPKEVAEYVATLQRTKERLEAENDVFLSMVQWYVSDEEKKIKYEQRIEKNNDEIQAIDFKMESLRHAENES